MTFPKLLAAPLAAPLAATVAFRPCVPRSRRAGRRNDRERPRCANSALLYPGVVTAFSSVSVTSSAGGSIPVSKPVNDPLDQQIVIVRLGRALGPGT